eukprot:EG_transcript_23989
MLSPGKDYVGVGCGALVFNARAEVLLLKRGPTARTDPGCWARPGGALNLGELAEDCVAREVREETGVEICDVQFQDLTQSMAEGQHWVALGYTATYASGKVQNREPTKHDAVGWFPLDHLPAPLAPYTRVAVQTYLERRPPPFEPASVLACR